MVQLEKYWTHLHAVNYRANKRKCQIVVVFFRAIKGYKDSTKPHWYGIDHSDEKCQYDFAISAVTKSMQSNI